MNHIPNKIISNNIYSQKPKQQRLKRITCPIVEIWIFLFLEKYTLKLLQIYYKTLTVPPPFV